jgi:hypothetical protein
MMTRVREKKRKEEKKGGVPFFVEHNHCAVQS